MQYRREIDGLRAVAVVPVILFHSGFALFPGGFVGVDIFFVISGYLITSILIAELEGEGLSIARFYERRARRILPALFIVILACIPAAWLLMLPDQFSSFARSVGWVSVFASNIYFYLNSGYFAASAELNPLLHTWSLAVEEQYYLFFPIVLALVWKYLGRRRVFALIALAAIASLLLSEWGWRHSPDANFYFAPTRAWELFAGSLCAFAGDRSSPRDNWTGVAGLALIAFAIFYYDGSVPFPSVYALVPVTGTALVILRGGTGTLAGRFLGNPLFVGIGLISYSAYLWHQPLFAFARIASFDEPPRALMMALVALTFGLAYLSWRFVEGPFRRRGGVFTKRWALFTASGAVAAGISLPLLAVASVPGITAVEHNHPELFKKREIVAAPSQSCEGFEAARKSEGTCRKYGNGLRRVVIWGDSHANVLSQVIRPIDGTTIYLVSHLGCPPLTGIARVDGKGQCGKPEILESYFDYVRSRQPDTVVMLARWSLYIYGWRRYGELQPISYFLTDGRAVADAAASADSVRNELHATIGELKRSSRVLVVSQPPDLQALSERSQVFLRTIRAETIFRWQEGEVSLLREAALREGATFLDPKALFCDQRICRLGTTDGYRNFNDDNHLSPVGLEQLWGRIAPIIAANPARNPSPPAR